MARWTLIISSRSATLYMLDRAMTQVPGSTFRFWAAACTSKYGSSSGRTSFFGWTISRTAASNSGSITLTLNAYLRPSGRCSRRSRPSRNGAAAVRMCPLGETRMPVPNDSAPRYPPAPNSLTSFSLASTATLS